MELHELHVAQLGPGAIGHRHAVAGGHRRDWSSRDRPGPRRRCTGSSAWPTPASCRAAAFQTSAPRQAPSCVSRSSVKVFSQVSTFGRPLRPLDHGPHHFLAGGVAQGVDDAVVAVAPFAAQRQLRRAPRRTACPSAISSSNPLGRLADDHLDDVAIAQVAAGRQRVGHVVLEAVFRVEHAGDAPLGVVAVRLPQAVLGDHQHATARGSAASAARKPASPPPMISTSVKWCGTRLGWNGTRYRGMRSSMARVAHGAGTSGPETVYRSVRAAGPPREIRLIFRRGRCLASRLSIVRGIPAAAWCGATPSPLAPGRRGRPCS